MQILFLCIGIIGILMLYYALKICIKSFNNKKLAEFALDYESKTIEIKANGLHAICFLGVGVIDNQEKFDTDYFDYFCQNTFL